MTIINVSSVAELYKAVNDINNAGNKIVLAAGKYELNPNDPEVGNFLGRLELQEDMELEGQPGDPGLVTIDESQLPINSFTVPPSFRTGGIRLGRGSNAIRWLTIIGKPDIGALSAIDTDLPSAKCIITISNIIVSGSQLAIDIRNPGFAGKNRVITASIEKCELKNNVVGGGQGISVQNANGADNCEINVTLKDNHIHHNNVGIRSWNLGGISSTTNASIKIKSEADRIVDNGIGLILNAGNSNTTNSVAHDNDLSFEAHGTKIENNNGVPAPLDRNLPLCQVFAAGGNSTAAARKASNNKLEIKIWGTQVSGGQPFDISIFGARYINPIPTGTDIAGIDNVAKIHLHGVSTKAKIESAASIPNEPAGTNKVIVITN
jgi:hypothetical protein